MKRLANMSNAACPLCGVAMPPKRFETADRAGVDERVPWNAATFWPEPMRALAPAAALRRLRFQTSSYQFMPTI